MCEVVKYMGTLIIILGVTTSSVQEGQLLESDDDTARVSCFDHIIELTQQEGILKK